MLLEAKSNGLAGTDFHPWHLKFTYQVFDSQGTVSGAGTVEEFWASRARSKKVISSGAFSQASFLTENGVVISGDKGQSPWEASTLLFDFANPLPGTRQITSNDFANMPAQPEENERCISMSGPLSFSRSASGTITYGEKGLLNVFCFDIKKLALERAGINDKFLTIFSKPVMFQDRWIPSEVTVTRDGKIAISAHLETIEIIANVDDAFFTPPPDAFQQIRELGVKGSGPSTTLTIPPGDFGISAGVAQGNLIHGTPPIYPAVAKAARVQGTVVLQARIADDGTVAELHVISGHPMLLQAAIDAVKQWVYKPYLLGGKPLEVMTTINVVFTLAEPPKTTSPTP
jgi:TonB family protein